MVLFLSLLSCELQVSVKENSDSKKITKKLLISQQSCERYVNSLIKDVLLNRIEHEYIC